VQFPCADDKRPFQLLGRVPKAHARIVWTVSCASDAFCFATGSRDNTIKLWRFGSREQGMVFPYSDPT